mmetsp:Transcript_45199/g.112372  ORF Transcript_45199/g.112372 Transcript_45199/m.112372 type:complete len:224 (-) Transcript_45199:245-916(-)
MPSSRPFKASRPCAAPSRRAAACFPDGGGTSRSAPTSAKDSSCCGSTTPSRSHLRSSCSISLSVGSIVCIARSMACSRCVDQPSARRSRRTHSATSTQPWREHASDKTETIASSGRMDWRRISAHNFKARLHAAAVPTEWTSEWISVPKVMWSNAAATCGRSLFAFWNACSARGTSEHWAHALRYVFSATVSTLPSCSSRRHKTSTRWRFLWAPNPLMRMHSE